MSLSIDITLFDCVHRTINHDEMEMNNDNFAYSRIFYIRWKIRIGLNFLKNSILEIFGSVCSINSNFVLRLRIGQTESIFQRVFHCHPRVMFIDHDGCQNDNSLCIPLYSGIFMNPSLICCWKESNFSINIKFFSLKLMND